MVRNKSAGPQREDWQRICGLLFPNQIHDIVLFNFIQQFFYGECQLADESRRQTLNIEWQGIIGGSRVHQPRWMKHTIRPSQIIHGIAIVRRTKTWGREKKKKKQGTNLGLSYTSEYSPAQLWQPIPWRSRQKSEYFKEYWNHVNVIPLYACNALSSFHTSTNLRMTLLYMP